MHRPLVALQVPEDDDHWREVDPCPDRCLCHNPTRNKVRRLVGEHTEHPFAHHAVYVLECRSMSEASVERTRIRKENESLAGSRGAPNADRIFYVGVSQRVAERVYLHATARGANFTEAFPPVRVVDVRCYPTLAESYRAEKQVAEALDEKYPRTFVIQR